MKILITESQLQHIMKKNKSKVIYNLDLLELGGNIEDLYRSKWDKIKPIEKSDDFSLSKVQDTVWRAGELKLDPRSGGLWFADSKEGVEKFALSVRGEVREGKPYHVNMQNPFFIKGGFWRGYIEMIGYDRLGRERLMRNLMKDGYDGIIINDDWWNDTGDDNAVYGKQYVVFDEKDVIPG